MKLSLHKSARFQRFLNRSHSAPVRIFFGVLAALSTLIATGDRVLVREIYQRLAQKNDFRLGLRLMSWYVCRRWPRLRLSNYNFFVFTHALDVPALIAQRRFLDYRASRADHLMWLCDCAYVSASLALQNPAALAQFAVDADAIFAMLAATDIASDDTTSAYHPPFSIPDAEEAIRDFASAFPFVKTPWFVLSGTFLGLVREGGILKHDHDIDLGITFDDVDLPAFIRALRADTRFSVYAEETQTAIVTEDDGGWGTRTLPVMFKITHRNGTSVDLFVHHREGDVIWHGSALYRWDNSAFDLVPYAFCGTTVLGPADADRYLTENYGNWRVPVKDFHFSVDTTNLRVVRNPLSLSIFLRRAIVSGATDPAARARIVRIIKDAGFLGGDGSTTAPYQLNPAAFGSPK